MDEEERNFCHLILLLSRVGLPKLRLFFIEEWDSAGGFVQWTDCPQNGGDLLTKFTPLSYEKDKVQSGDSKTWDLSLFIKVLLYSKPPFVHIPNKALVDSLLFLKETRNTLCHTGSGRIASAEFRKLYTDACNALTNLGASPSDFKTVEDDMKQLPLSEVLALVKLCTSQGDEILELVVRKVIEALRQENIQQPSVELHIIGMVKLVAVGGIIATWAAGSAYIINQYIDDPELMLSFIRGAIAPSLIPLGWAVSRIIGGSFKIILEVYDLQALDSIWESYSKSKMVQNLQEALITDGLKNCAPKDTERVELSLTISELDYKRARDTLQQFKEKEESRYTSLTSRLDKLEQALQGVLQAMQNPNRASTSKPLDVKQLPLKEVLALVKLSTSPEDEKTRRLDQLEQAVQKLQNFEKLSTSKPADEKRLLLREVLALVKLCTSQDDEMISKINQLEQAVKNLETPFTSKHAVSKSSMYRRKVDIPKDVMGLVIGKKHSNLKRIQEQTGAMIDVINYEIYVSGLRQQCEHAIRLLETCAPMAKGVEGKIKVGIPEEVMGAVIGSQHRNLNTIREETKACIDIIQRQLYVSGGKQECKNAIRKLKTSASTAVYSKYAKKMCPPNTYDFVDGTGKACEFLLNALEESPRHDWNNDKEYFRIKRIDEEDDELNGEINIDDLNNFMLNVLQKIQNDSGGGEIPKANFWCHFGEIYITQNVDEDDQGKTYPLEELQEQFNKKQGWKMVFSSSIKNMKVKCLEEALSESKSKTIPFHIRYDLYFLTPTCSRIRAKFFVDFDGNSLNHRDFVSQFIDAQEDPSESSTSQYVLCKTFVHRGKISIAIPSRAMDVRILIRTVLPSRDMKEKEHADALRQYLDNITFTEEGKIQLPDDKEMPGDFALQFLRKCTRRFYTYNVTEEDSFTIVVSDEEEMDEENNNEVKNAKTDVHLYSDQCNALLRSEDWTPEQIVSKLPSFLSALRAVQDNISTSYEEE